MQPKYGFKRSQFAATNEEYDKLQQLYTSFRKELISSNNDRCVKRSLGTWDPEQQAVLVKRKNGKFGKFGFNSNGNFYLERIEAMFLLELRRLQLEYNEMVLSIEQAYLFLLGESSSFKYNEYLVYSHFTRAGYILVHHQNISHFKQVESTDEDCAWALALSSLNKRAIAETVKRSPHFSKVKKHFKFVKEAIMHQHDGDISADTLGVSKINFQCKISTKRKINEEAHEQEEAIRVKRKCLEATIMRKSLVGCLKDEADHKRFADLFGKFDMIDLNVSSLHDNNNVRTLKINYDIYLHNDGFKKSCPQPPKFRLIILGSNEPFPIHAEVLQCYELQKYMVPLLVVSVGESKQMQSFLYYFS